MFVKKISQDYFKYNPEGEVYFRPAVCECCGQPYIEQVGIFNEEDKNLVNDEFDVCEDKGEFFTVVRVKKGLFKTAEACEKHIKRSKQDD